MSAAPVSGPDQAGDPAAARPRARWPWRVLAATYAVAVLALCAAAVHTHGLSCEGFGCMGVGILWIAWACVSALVLLVGAVSLGQLRRGRWATLTGGALAVQLLSVGWLLWLWLRSRPDLG